MDDIVRSDGLSLDSLSARQKLAENSLSLKKDDTRHLSPGSSDANLPGLDLLDPRGKAEDIEVRALRRIAGDLSRTLFKKAETADVGQTISARSLDPVNIGDGQFHYFNTSISFKVTEKTDTLANAKANAKKDAVVKITLTEAEFTDRILAPMLQKDFESQRDSRGGRARPLDLTISTGKKDLTGRFSVEVFCGPDACWRWKK